VSNRQRAGRVDGDDVAAIERVWRSSGTRAR
jgi:hypothetical protein